MGWSNLRATGLTQRDDRGAGGYTLVTPVGGDWVLLLDEGGRIAHAWTPPCRPGYAYLLENGHVLVRGQPKGSDDLTVAQLGGTGGLLLELDWSGNVVWNWSAKGFHHDMCRLPNGNTLALMRDPIPDEIAREIVGGIQLADLTSDQMKSPSLREIQLFKEETIGMVGDAVWEIAPDGSTVNVWHVHEHLNPRQDRLCPLEPRVEWTHANAVQSCPDGDILLSFRNIDTVMKVGWPSGDVKWKWGAGSISHQHNPTYIPDNRVLLFDNGAHHPDAAVPRS